ncbi:MAG TPA: hypothetical protein VKX28_26980 [Xanthobacteraceae bacterium]|nr:hypothetical protein [Xanthobacteraceae bacterium]
MIEPKSTDVGRRVAFMVGEERQLGAIADFNCTYVHVTLRDGSTIPLPRTLLEWAQENEDPQIEADAAVRAALPDVERSGLEFKIVDRRRILLVASGIEAMPCTGTWSGRDGEVRYGGIAAAIAAARAMAAPAEQLSAEEGEPD